jgi:Carboxypeptidase regulatory-like domain
MHIVDCRIALALGVALLSLGCSSLLGSEAGLPAPKDPGTVVASVRDTTGAPVADANVQVHDIPNTVGSTYSVGQRTNRNGSVTFTYIPAGHRRVEVTAPPGFRAAATDLIKPVDVVKDESVAVSFVLARN